MPKFVIELLAGRKKWGWREVIGIVAGTVAVWGIVVFWPRERLLIEAAYPVMKVNLDKQQLCWISAHRLLLVTTEQRGNFVPDSNGALAWATWKGSVDLLDITTHTKSHTPALTELFQRTTVFPIQEPSEFEASPDGLWLLWATHIEEHRTPWLHVVRLDGTHYRKLNRCFPNDCLFLDTHHLAQMLLEEPVMVVCDLQNPAQDRKYPKLEQARAALAHYHIRIPVPINVSASDNNGDKGFAEIDIYRTEDRIQKVLDWPGVERYVRKPIQTRILKLPEGATFDAGKPSPQDRSIFYHLQSSRTSPFLAWLHRLIPQFHSKPTLTESLWISPAEGQGMHELGHVPTHLDEDGNPEDLLGDVQWLPDGKQISFVYQSTLYVMPVTYEKGRSR